MRSKHVSIEQGVAQGEYFNEIYPDLTNKLLSKGQRQYSRNGDTFEVLDFKTQVFDPKRRCVGVNNRDINIFFLIAEAIWIWNGRKDVEFLKYFNSNITQFSDDGESFHAPYGFRIRHHGVSSFDKHPKRDDSSKHGVSELLEGHDQLLSTLNLLASEPSTRRAVIAIWNPSLDQDVVSKDLPCNDLLMFQERQGRLNITVSNRSNDLHWGLTTNMFQFSWILENMCSILQLQVGTQTHNSKSLHIYLENPISKAMLDSTEIAELYEHTQPLPMDFAYEAGINVQGRLEAVDRVSRDIEDHIRHYMTSTAMSPQVGFLRLSRVSQFYGLMYGMLIVYCNYKRNKASNNDDDACRAIAVAELMILASNFPYKKIDMIELGLNWFIKRIKDRPMLTNMLTANFPMYQLPSYLGNL